MKFLHGLNCALWLANAVTWAAYAHVWPMAAASLAAAGVAAFLCRGE